MAGRSEVKVLYLVSMNATTSVPLEAAGKMEEIASQFGVDFSVASYYQQKDPSLRAGFTKRLTELNFKHSFSLHTLKTYYKLIKSKKPDVLHLHHGVSAFQGAILGKMAGVPVVIKTEHNDHRFYKWYQKILTVPVFLFSNKIICNSNNTLLSFYPWEKWIAKNKSRFIYNGTNVARIQSLNSPGNTKATRQKYNIEATDRLFVSVGRLIPQKNYEILFNGFEQALKTNSNIKLIIAGGGPLEKKLNELIIEKGLSRNVKLLGMIQRDDVYRLINAADFFIIASKWEGFCNAVVEAMAAGKPVVSSDIPTLREVIGNDSGIFFNFRSSAHVADSIREIVSLPQQEIERMSSCSRTRSIENFTIESSARSYLREYVTVRKN